MAIEYEATFSPVDKEAMRSRLKACGAILRRPEYLQTRVTFNLPTTHPNPHAWVRVRNEGDKITLSFKKVDGRNIDNQHEICLIVSDFDRAVDFLSALGCQRKSYQESKRELWQLLGTDITLDTWPWLETFVEIEGPNEPSVKQASRQLGFDYNQAKFCAVTDLYCAKYNLSVDIINNQTPLIVFAGPNPFIKG